MGLIKFFRAQWTDAKKSGNWMAEVNPSLRFCSDRRRLRSWRAARWAAQTAWSAVTPISG